VPVKKRTPWRPHPDGEATERAGGREWFSDHLFVDAEEGHPRAGYGTSITVHVSCAIALIIGVLTRPDQTLLLRVGPSLMMPTMMSMPPAASAPSPASRSIERSAPDRTSRPQAPPPPAPATDVTAATPVDAPSGIKPETGAESGGEGGVAGGVPGGIAGGQLDGVPSSSPSPGPLRLDGGGGSIKPPRKIKDVKPIYPQGVLSDHARGTVIIEATIGVDGKVQEAVVLHSVPALDQPALDAVRQWEYTPSLLNGVPVAIVMRVVVKFAIQ
jgi:protein TonB